MQVTLARHSDPNKCNTTITIERDAVRIGWLGWTPADLADICNGHFAITTEVTR